MARVHAHLDRWAPKMDSLLFAILGFVSPLWIRQTDIQGHGSPFRHARILINNVCFPASSPSFSLFQQPPPPPHPPPTPPPPPPWRSDKPQLTSWKLEPNPTATREVR